MSNKLYNGNNTDYLISGASKSGYMKNSKKGYPGDNSVGGIVKDFNTGIKNDGETKGWFEGKKSNVGVGGRGATGV